MATHKELDVWKLGMNLVEKIYKVTNTFPSSEQFGLMSQMRRAAVSIPSNIAKGAARDSSKENIHFLYFSLGSLSELETQCLISQRLGFLNDKSIFEEITIVKMKLINFIKYMKSSTSKPLNK
ncbi:MAG: four helix bundle protein [Candidatus Cloacimonadota bacterium]|nr:four helix bundle protein [Candidatus Cloacimonadota bacterium]